MVRLPHWVPYSVLPALRNEDEALKEARDKARVEEKEVQAVRDKCDKRRRQDMQFKQFLDYKLNVLDTF